MTAVGFEPTQLALVELESTPLDHSGKLSCLCRRLPVFVRRSRSLSNLSSTGYLDRSFISPQYWTTAGTDWDTSWQKRPARSQQPDVYLEPKWLRWQYMSDAGPSHKVVFSAQEAKIRTARFESDRWWQKACESAAAQCVP